MNCKVCGKHSAAASLCNDCLTKDDGADDTLALTESSVTLVHTGPTSRATQATTARADAGLPELDSSRYKLIRSLGEGGMGSVYLAKDIELNRNVAMKMIRPELARSSEIMARFRREVQLAVQVTHPNVLRVYDVGTAGNTSFLTMEYVEGEELGHTLGPESSMPIERCVSLLQQILSGLGAAHAKGVVHRNLKPANILIDLEGNVRITDFGLASSAASSQLTRTGAVLGTPLYMSPEQVAGKSVDQRSDIYSFGVIAYEILTGELAFRGDSPLAIMSQRLHRDPDPITSHRPDVPPYLERIVKRCLERSPEDRYGTVEEIAQDLEQEQHTQPPLSSRIQRRLRQWPLVGWALPVLAVGLLFAWGIASDVAEPTSDREPQLGSMLGAAQRVAVLPLESRASGEENAWLGEALAQLTIDNLAQSRSVRVLSPERVRNILKQDGLLEDHLRDAGVHALVAGEILPAAEQQLRATVRVTILENGEQVATRTIVASSQEDLIARSTELAAGVRRALGLPLSETVDVFAADFASDNPDAYAAYLEGLRGYSAYDYEAAQNAFEKALSLSPQFTMARYRLASVVATMGQIELGRELMEHASRESSGLPHREQLYIRAGLESLNYQAEEAVETYRSLVGQYPYETEARFRLADSLQILGRFEEAAAELETLRDIEPQNQALWSMLGTAQLKLENWGPAAAAFENYKRLAPESPNAYHLLGDAYRSQGELTLAAREFEKALEVDETFSYSAVSLGVVQALNQEYRGALEALLALSDDQDALMRNRIDATFEAISILRAQGRTTEALDLLEHRNNEIEEEGVRQALSSSVRGLLRLRQGDWRGAEEDLQWAVENSPGPPTRYLFARAELEIARASQSSTDFEQVLRTAEEIESHALPPDNPDRTEERAAAYLRGRVALMEERFADAEREFQRSVILSGYRYSVYRTGLARALARQERDQEALATLREAMERIDVAEPRLDLLLDHSLARLDLAELHRDLGNRRAAERLLEPLNHLWRQADANFSPLIRLSEIERSLATLPE